MSPKRYMRTERSIKRATLYARLVAFLVKIDLFPHLCFPMRNEDEFLLTGKSLPTGAPGLLFEELPKSLRRVRLALRF